MRTERGTKQQDNQAPIRLPLREGKMSQRILLAKSVCTSLWHVNYYYRQIRHQRWFHYNRTVLRIFHRCQAEHFIYRVVFNIYCNAVLTKIVWCLEGKFAKQSVQKKVQSKNARVILDEDLPSQSNKKQLHVCFS